MEVAATPRILARRRDPSRSARPLAVKSLGEEHEAEQGEGRSGELLGSLP